MTGLSAQALVSNDTDVTDVEYTVQQVDCDSGDPIGDSQSVSRELEDQGIPGNLLELADNPLDAESLHAFADMFLAVEAGCYDVATTPLNEDGEPSEDCARAHKAGVEAIEGETVEVFLINQCEGEDPAAIDVISTLNQEPTLDDVWFEDSKFACGSSSEVCASGSDPENDPVEFDLVLAEDAPCELEALPSEDGTQCWELSCSEWGKHEFTIFVYDLLHGDGGLMRVEDWLADEGYPSESHAELNTYAYFDGLTVYEDNDGDGSGDPESEELLCDDDDTDGYVDNGDDCDDTDEAVHPDAPEICGDEVDNNCDGIVDEDCEPPAPGTDIVVFNDINVFDNVYGATDPNNYTMWGNLFDYTHAGPRGAGTTVLMDRGRGSVCGATGECSPGTLSEMYGVVTGLGYSISDVASTSGSLTSFDPDVKVIMLWNPLEEFTVDEINAMKDFAAEGGRVIFVGEWDGYYGAGIGVENAFLLNMGAVMTNTGGAVDCGLNTIPPASMRPHQITHGVSQLAIACASVIEPGPGDYVLYYDTTDTLVLAGVATIDTTHISSVELADSVISTTDASLESSSASGE